MSFLAKFNLKKMASKLKWSSVLKVTLLLLVIMAIVTAFHIVPVEKTLKDLLEWIGQDLGPWGPLVLAATYIPITILALPVSVLTIGGGYHFGLPIGFAADSLGSAAGASAAFSLGRTVGKSYVYSKLKGYPQFRAVAIAIQRSGFKIVLLLRLVPILPFSMVNYLLSVTPVSSWEYMLATWLGMMPSTFVWVYIGTTLKDISDVTHGWNKISKTHMVFIKLGLVVAVVLLLICITKVAKSALEKALEEIENVEGADSRQFLVGGDSNANLQEPLIIKIDSPLEDGHEN